MGCDLRFVYIGKARDLFQSTHPRGVRRRISSKARSRTGFNPRTRVGCDLRFVYIGKARDLFQSTHPRGVRRQLQAKATPLLGVSIHAPAWGATD